MYKRQGGDGTGVGLLVIGAAMGMVLMLASRSCDRAPMPTPGHAINDLRCSVCHFERVPVLNNGKKYKSYHQRKHHVATIDNAKEQEYLSRLIAGGKP